MSKELKYQKRPQIYIYSSPNQPGVKVGYTERVTKSNSDYDAVKERIEEGLVNTPNPQYKIEHYEPAVTKAGEFFKDHLVHKWLENLGIQRLAGEWFDTDVATVRNIIAGIKNGTPESGNSKATFKMRPEQVKFVEETAEYFRAHQDESEPPRFLWNAKMRFGKTFTSYQLAKKMGWTRILVLTYKPGVEKEWKKDVTMLAYHLRYLQKKYWKTKYSVNFPRMRPAQNEGFQPNCFVNDRELAQVTFAMRIFDHDVDISYSTREPEFIRNNMCTLGVTTMSAASRVNPGGYYSYPQALEQFTVSDDRTVEEIANALKARGIEPVWKDWDGSFDHVNLMINQKAV